VKDATELKMDEDKGPKCIVCHEGYSKKPTDILGVYTYSKKAALVELVG
jgi:E3 ubiquitin-protein ligase UBR4